MHGVLCRGVRDAFHDVPERRKHRQRFGALGSGRVRLNCRPAATLLLDWLGRVNNEVPRDRESQSLYTQIVPAFRKRVLLKICEVRKRLDCLAIFWLIIPAASLLPPQGCARPPRLEGRNSRGSCFV